MKLIRVFVGIFAGIFLSTVICWWLLYAYGSYMYYILHKDGSLFDTHPYAANAFFISWTIVAMIGAIAGALYALNKTKPSK